MTIRPIGFWLARAVRAGAGLLALAAGLCVAPAAARAQVAVPLPELERDCSGARAESCYRDGLRRVDVVLRQGGPLAVDSLAAAVLLLFNACRNGVGDGCYIAGRITEASFSFDTAGLAGRGAQALYLFQTGCEVSRSSGPACAAAGFHHAQRPRHTHLDSALHFLGKGCEEGEPAACYRAAELMDEWMAPGAPRSAVATARIREACAARSPAACLSLALRAEERLSRAGVAQRLTPAFRLERDEVRRAYARACGDSLPAGCTALGMLHASGGLGLPVSPDSARWYLVPACTGDPANGVVGHGAACAALGRMAAGVGFGPVAVESPRWTEVDTAAVRWFQQGCTLLDAAACADLGYFGYGLGRLGGSLAAFRARTACEEGSGYGCRILGLLAREGAGGERYRAEQYLRQGCMLDDGPACRHVGEIVGEPQSFKYFRRACALGDGAGCRGLSLQVPSTWESGQPDTTLLQRACDLGDPEGCLDLARMARDAGREVQAGEFLARACRLHFIHCKQRI